MYILFRIIMVMVFAYFLPFPIFLL